MKLLGLFSIEQTVVIALIGLLTAFLPKVLDFFSTKKKNELEHNIALMNKNSDLIATLQEEQEAIREELKNQIEELKAEIDILKQRNSYQEVEILDLRKENVKLEKENMGLQKRVLELEFQNRNLNGNK